MTARVGDAYVDVHANTQAFGRELDRGVTSAAQGATRSMGGLKDAVKAVGTTAVVAFGALAVKAIGDFVSDSVRAFSELEQSVGGTEAVFGDASAEIDAFAKSSAESVGLAESEFRTATTLIGGQLKRMTGDVGFASDAAIDLVTVGADLAATYGGTTKEAVDAFAAALRGEADPAERFNLNLKISEVNAKAVELGLADTTSEVDENAKAQALLALVTEQSADAQGQFAEEIDTVAGQAQVAAASIEDMKARAGEALVPFKNLTTQLQVLGAQTLGSVASSIQNLVGQITPAQDAINQFEILTGETADSLAAMVTINRETGLSFSELAVEMELTAGEAKPLTESQIAFLESIGLTRDEIEELDAVLTDKHAVAMQDVIENSANAYLAFQNQRAGTEDLTEATEDNSAAVQANIDALKNQQDTMRAQTDPIFALFKADQDLAGAQQAVTDAINEFGEGSPEHITALANLTESSFDLRDAQAEARVATDLTKDEFIKMGVQAGGARDQVQLLADKLFALEGLRLDPIRLDIEIRELRRAAGSQAGGPQEFAEGGMVQGAFMGQAVPIIAHVGERVLNPQETRTYNAGGTFSPTVNINVTGNADPGRIGFEVERALKRLADQRAVR